MSEPKPDPQVVRSTLEVDGAEWIVWRRLAPDGRVEAVSFDGENFHAKGSDAYLAAKKAGRLVSPSLDSLDQGAGALPEDAAAATLEIARAICSLRPGEELRVVHNGSALVVVKNKIVASFRPSVFSDVGLGSEEDA